MLPLSKALHELPPSGELAHEVRLRGFSFFSVYVFFALGYTRSIRALSK